MEKSPDRSAGSVPRGRNHRANPPVLWYAPGVIVPRATLARTPSDPFRPVFFQPRPSMIMRTTTPTACRSRLVRPGCSEERRRRWEAATPVLAHHPGQRRPVVVDFGFLHPPLPRFVGEELQHLRPRAAPDRSTRRQTPPLAVFHEILTGDRRSRHTLPLHGTSVSAFAHAVIVCPKVVAVKAAFPPRRGLRISGGVRNAGCNNPPRALAVVGKVCLRPPPPGDAARERMVAEGVITGFPAVQWEAALDFRLRIGYNCVGSILRRRPLDYCQVPMVYLRTRCAFVAFGPGTIPRDHS